MHTQHFGHKYFQVVCSFVCSFVPYIQMYIHVYVVIVWWLFKPQISNKQSNCDVGRNSIHREREREIESMLCCVDTVTYTHARVHVNVHHMSHVVMHMYIHVHIHVYISTHAPQSPNPEHGATESSPSGREGRGQRVQHPGSHAHRHPTDASFKVKVQAHSEEQRTGSGRSL